jgi:VWFA-related protein
MKTSSRFLAALACGAVASFLLVPCLCAQDQATSRNVSGRQQAAGAEVIINQIDTSAYPKVTIFATVAKGGVPLKGLQSADFRVREDEVDQEPLTVVPKLTPLNAVITLDNSGSMKKRLADAKTAAKSFIDLLNPDDKVQVLSFARDVKVLSADGNREAAKLAIDSTVARGDTALYDAIYTSVATLRSTPGRKAIALLSDGADDDGTGKQLSKHSVDEALALAREVNVPIFVVGVGTELDESTLNKVAAQTGGDCLIAPQPEQLKAMYAKIGEQLAGQYNIYYTSDLPGDGTDHRVQLTYGGVTGMKEFKAPLLAQATPTPTPVYVAPAPTPAPEPQGINIFAPQYSELVASPNNQWEALLAGSYVSLYYGQGDGIYGLKNDASATINAVRVCITETNIANIRNLELSVADSPAGPFTQVAKVEVANMNFAKTGGWQEFKFEPVTARYYRLKLDAKSNIIGVRNNGSNRIQIAGKIDKASPEPSKPVAIPDDKMTNLFTPGCSEMVAAPNNQWEALLAGGNVSLYHGQGDGIYGLKNDASATINAVRVCITETNIANIRNLELSVADSPTGPFTQATKVEVANTRFAKTGGWQEFKFAPVTAKYYRLKLDAKSNVIGVRSNGSNRIEIMGKLSQ